MKKKVVLLFAATAVLFSAVLLFVYSPLLTRGAEFVGDDFYYVTQHKVVQSLSLQSLYDIFTKPLEFEYFPVTIVSFAADVALWGPDPGMFHATNVIIFLLIGISTLCLSLRLNRDLGAGRGLNFFSISLLSAAVLLLHPVNVESVAAISNRKELLYVLLGLLSFMFYTARSGGAVTYILALFFLAAAQLSKGTGVILPLLFLLYELLYQEAGNRDYKKMAFRFLPCFVISALIFIYQFSVASGGGVVAVSPVSWESRIGGVFRTASMALEKFLLPVNLTYEYDIRWPASLALSPEWVAPFLTGIIAIFLVFRKRFRLLFLLMLSLIPFLPYLNIVPLRHIIEGNIVYYDHYLLFSVVAASALLTRCLLSISPRWQRYALVTLSIVGIFFIFYDHRLSGYWKTRESLYRHEIELAPRISRPYYFLGQTLLEKGRYDEALRLFLTAGSMNQPSPSKDFYQWLGDAYAFSGRYPEAEWAYKMHLTLRPGDRKSLQNLSSTLIMLNRDEEAREVIRTLLSLYPNDSDARGNLDLIERREAQKRRGG